MFLGSGSNSSQMYEVGPRLYQTSPGLCIKVKIADAAAAASPRKRQSVVGRYRSRSFEQRIGVVKVRYEKE